MAARARDCISCMHGVYELIDGYASRAYPGSQKITIVQEIPPPARATVTSVILYILHGVNKSIDVGA